MAKKSGYSEELEALGKILDALADLDEDQRAFVYKTAGDRLEISGRSTRRRNGGGTDRTRDQEDLDDDVTPKEFMRDKSATTDVETVVCLAYYLTKYRDTPTFKTREITALNTEAALPGIGNASQAVKNATHQNHYLTAAGRGAKQITALGEDVVESLPDRDAVAAVLAKKTKRKRRKKRKKKTTTRKAGTRKKATARRAGTRKTVRKKT